VISNCHHSAGASCEYWPADHTRRVYEYTRAVGSGEIERLVLWLSLYLTAHGAAMRHLKEPPPDNHAAHVDSKDAPHLIRTRMALLPSDQSLRVVRWMLSILLLGAAAIIPRAQNIPSSPRTARGCRSRRCRQKEDIWGRADGHWPSRFRTENRDDVSIALRCCLVDCHGFFVDRVDSVSIGFKALTLRRLPTGR